MDGDLLPRGIDNGHRPTRKADRYPQTMRSTRTQAPISATRGSGLDEIEEPILVHSFDMEELENPRIALGRAP